MPGVWLALNRNDWSVGRVLAKLAVAFELQGRYAEVGPLALSCVVLPFSLQTYSLSVKV